MKTNLTMHVGRHTFATLALQNGVRIEHLKEMMAHSSCAMTEVYAKVIQDTMGDSFSTVLKD